MTGDSDRRDSGEPPEPPWHERTSTVVAASAGALAVIAIAYFLISTLITEFSDPDPVQQYFMEPSGTTSRTTSSATTTTQTITSTRAPVTTDINPGEETTTSGSETSGTETSGTETTSGSETSESPSTTTSRSPRSTTEDNGQSTRTRPRLNETRTLYPRP